MKNVLIFILLTPILYSQNQTIEDIHLHFQKSEHFFKATTYDSAYHYAKAAYLYCRKIQSSHLKSQAALAIAKSKIVETDEEFSQHIEKVVDQSLRNKNFALLDDTRFVKSN